MLNDYMIPISLVVVGISVIIFIIVNKNASPAGGREDSDNKIPEISEEEKLV